MDQTSLLQFQRSFPDDAACAAFAFKLRWPEGFRCPKCGGRRAALLRSRAHTYECLDCGRQTSVTAGTVMHRSKLPLATWFWAAHLLATQGMELSSSQLERQLGVSYRTAWLILQKLRRSILALDQAPLRGRVECGYVELAPHGTSRAAAPREAKPIVVVAALEVGDSSTERAPETACAEGRENGRLGRIRLSTLPDNSAAAVAAFLRANVAPGAVVVSDGAAIPRAFALLKRWGLGASGGRRLRHIDRDLRDLGLRFNFRFHGSIPVATILGLAAAQEPATYWEIVGRPKPQKEHAAIRRRVRRRRTALGLRPDRTAATRGG
jgi:transposase-like protein